MRGAEQSAEQSRAVRRSERRDKKIAERIEGSEKKEGGDREDRRKDERAKQIGVLA